MNRIFHGFIEIIFWIAIFCSPLLISAAVAFISVRGAGKKKIWTHQVYGRLLADVYIHGTQTKINMNFRNYKFNNGFGRTEVNIPTA